MPDTVTPSRRKKYVLDRQQAVEFLADEALHLTCPLYLQFRGPAIALTSRQAFAQQVTPGCNSCGGNRQLDPFYTAFCLHTADLLALSRKKHDDATLLEPLREYMATKLGCTPDPVVMYYKTQDGLTHRITF